MKYKALYSFTGAVNAAFGEVIEIKDKNLADRLINSGLIKSVDEKNHEYNFSVGKPKGKKKEKK